MIAKLREQQATWKGVDRKAQNGDRVTIDFTGTRDGQPFDGGSAQGTKLELGSGSMIPGFESGHVGTSAGEQRTLDLTFPADYHAEDLRDAAVKFEVTVHTVEERELPELDEAFFEKFEVKGSDLEAFRAGVRESMEKQLEDAIESKIKQQVEEQLLEAINPPIPAALIANEIATLRRMSISRFGGNQSDFDENLLPDDLFREQAQKRVAISVILGKLWEVHEIKPTREDVLAYVEKLASAYDDPQEARNYFLSDEQRLQQVQLMVMEKLAIEKVLGEAEVNEKSETYQSVVQR
jgi:trigger factor